MVYHPNATEDDYTYILNSRNRGGSPYGAVDFVLVIIGMVTIFTILDFICCVCYQRGVMWQKCGNRFDEDLSYDNEISSVVT